MSGKLSRFQLLLKVLYNCQKSRLECLIKTFFENCFVEANFFQKWILPKRFDLSKNLLRNTLDIEEELSQNGYLFVDDYRDKYLKVWKNQRLDSKV